MDRARGETGYEVERSSDGGSTYSLLTTLAADAAGYTDTRAAVGAQYRYRVRSSDNGSHSAYSNIVIANPGAAPPGNPEPAPAPTPTNSGSSASGGGAAGLAFNKMT